MLEMCEFFIGFEDNVVVEVDGFGFVCICYGLLCSDEECVIFEIFEVRVCEFVEGVVE